MIFWRETGSEKPDDVKYALTLGHYVKYFLNISNYILCYCTLLYFSFSSRNKKVREGQGHLERHYSWALGGLHDQDPIPDPGESLRNRPGLGAGGKVPNPDSEVNLSADQGLHEVNP